MLQNRPTDQGVASDKARAATASRPSPAVLGQAGIANAASYVPPGHSELRDKMLEVADHFEGDKQVAVALAFCLNLLTDLGKNSLSPTQTRMCAAYVDAFSDCIPGDVREMMRDAKAMNARKRQDAKQLGPKDVSAVGNADLPNHHPGDHHEG